MQISKEKENKSEQKMLPLPLKLVREAITHHPLLFSQNTHHRRRSSRRRRHRHRRDLEEEEEEEGGDDDVQNDACNSRPGFYNFHHHSSKSTKPKTKTKTPLLFFLPTRELINDTFRLANIAREMGMDLYPTPSLSHIIFSFSSYSASPSSSSSSSASSSSAASSSALSLSSSFSMPLPSSSVLISFPSLSSSSLSHLRSFVSLSKGLFKLVFFTADEDSDNDAKSDDARDWDCCSISLFSRRTGDRIESMQSFSRALAGMGWTLFTTRKNPSPDPLNSATKSVYLFRKVDSGIVRGGRGHGERRVRELRLPSLDFSNAPLKILQYVVLMTDDAFYLR